VKNGVLILGKITSICTFNYPDLLTFCNLSLLIISIFFPLTLIIPSLSKFRKELGIKKGDILIGRPMGMSCGCPITHCGITTDVDARNGVINWCVTGPLKPRNEGFIDIGYYVAQGYEGIIKESKVPIQLGMRYWFMPRRCMLQWRHSGLVNAITKMKDGSLKIRIEGLFIG